MSQVAVLILLLSLSLSHGANADPLPPPLCYLSGEVTTKTKVLEEKPAADLSSVIRLRFDSDDTEDCRLQFEAWCQSKVITKGYEVKSLRGYFKATPTSPQTDFEVQRSCETRKIAPPKP